jgi:hypothetical protein
MDLIRKALNGAISSPDVQAALDGILPPSGAAPMEGGRYDRLIDAANRLPRPALAFGAIAMLLFAMINPTAFAQRMAALKAAPAELWWILGAVIATHFGAREAHHMRHRTNGPAAPLPGETPPDHPA